MASRLLAVAALLVVLGALAASAGAAKEGVVARVVTPIPRDAEPGSRLTVVWTLYSVDAGKRHPFGGGYVFVRLLGPNGSRSPRTYGENPEPGRFRAKVRAPRGGVRGVEFGIMGTACDPKGCRPSPKIFPVVGRVFR